jgi:hypothetical protein
MSGDLVPFVLNCAAKLGARPRTNDLPHLQAEWLFKTTPLKIGTVEQVQDVIVLTGDHLDEVQAFLKQAFGEPDLALGSRPLSSVKGSNARQGIYSLKQIGAALTFGEFTIRPLGVQSTTTMITIMGSPRP